MRYKLCFNWYTWIEFIKSYSRNINRIQFFLHNVLGFTVFFKENIKIVNLSTAKILFIYLLSPICSMFGYIWLGRNEVGILNSTVDLNLIPVKVFFICHWNLNSFSAHNFIKLSILKAYIINKKFDVVCLSETCLNASIHYVKCHNFI